MADAQPMESNSKVPKVQLSHIGLAGGLTAAILMLNPVKQFFYTREEGHATELRVEKTEAGVNELRVSLDKMRAELQEQQNKNTDRILQGMSDRDQRVENRFNSLENSLNRNIEMLLRREAIDQKPSPGRGK